MNALQKDDKSYFRIITDVFPRASSYLSSIANSVSWKVRIFVVFYFFLLLVGLFGSFLYLSRSYIEIRAERREVISELSYWESVIERHPQYPDAFYNASYYSLRLGDRDAAFSYLEHALVYDASFSAALDLREEIY